MSRPTVAEIDLLAFENNWKVLSQLQSPQKLIPVVKANAYGHEIQLLAPYFQKLGIQRVGVAMYEEALALRQAKFNDSIFILGPFFENEISEFSKNKITPIVGSKENLLILKKMGFKNSIHLKWNTGMNRLGLGIEEIFWVRNWIKENPQVQVKGFCTHFHSSSDFNNKDGHCEKQIKIFQKIEHEFSDIIENDFELHLFNSDSFFANVERPRLTFPYGARPGIALYGYTEIENQWTSKLKPVMTLKTKIVHLISVKKGETVSYNATWKAPKDSQIAILPIGYADGYPRSLSNKGQVFVRGQCVPLVGIVCMDYLMIDVTSVPGISIGDDVELWGKNMSLKSLAQKAGTIVYELTSALTTRVPRILINEKE